MPRAHANGIELEYDVIGDREAPPLLLIMGLGTQMIAWPDEFCALLAERSLRVIRFDNRDVGLSTRPAAGYTLDDMADDTVGLLDALGIAEAHVCGASMGGFIAQLVAIRAPARVRTLTLMMTSTGDRSVGAADPDILPMLLQPVPVERDAYLDYRVRITRRLSSPGYPFDETRVRDLNARAYDRAYWPIGAQRQLAAVMASSDRTAALARVRAPTLILHGEADPIVNISGAHALARAIPDSKLRTLPGMAHDLPRALWPTLADEIAANARRSSIG
jgi:pimeloyl-ACP methyl ester carboxylesterase